MALRALILRLLCFIIQCNEVITLGFRAGVDLSRRLGSMSALHADVKQNMTLDAAARVLQGHAGVPPLLLAFVHESLGQVRHDEFEPVPQMTVLDHVHQPPDYRGLSAALDGMARDAEESTKREFARCSESEAGRLQTLSEAKEDLDAASSRAASLRNDVRRAREKVGFTQPKLSMSTDALAAHDKKCAADIADLSEHVASLDSDIGILFKILGLMRCNSRTTLLQCSYRDMANQSFVTFGHRLLRQEFLQLRSPGLQSDLQQTLAGAYGEATPAGAPAVHLPGGEAERLCVPPRCVEMRPGHLANPHGKPRHTCRMASNPNCKSLRDRFVAIQAGIRAKRDQLKESMAAVDLACGQNRQSYENQLADLRAQLDTARADLDVGVAQQGELEEYLRGKRRQYGDDQASFGESVQRCNSRVKDLLTQACALDKVREALDQQEAESRREQDAARDCEVSPWVAEGCSATCGGGTQRLSRAVVRYPGRYGAACPPLASVRACNDVQCPADCQLGDWGAWTACSAGCGDGVRVRSRTVLAEPEHGGRRCDGTTETEACNAQSCDRDCVLGAWTSWSSCSKACNGGLNHRERPVTSAAAGRGSCPNSTSPQRRQYKPCNSQACVRGPGRPTLQCKSEIDVVLLLDGSGSLGEDGWQAAQTFAAMFASAMVGSEAGVRLAVQVSSGPEDLPAYCRCSGKRIWYCERFTGGPDPQSDCNIEWVSHFTSDTHSVADKIKTLEWPKGGTLTAAALAAADAELPRGREGAAKVVVVVTDGKPTSASRTYEAAARLRERARLMWVPVTKHAPLKIIEQMASQPLRENIIAVRDFHGLSRPETLDEIVANMCTKLG